MKIIIPMAGRGSRLRPHTLTIPKPLIPVGGKPIVHRLVEDIASVCDEKIEDIAFVIGDFGQELEQDLIRVAEKMGARAHICYQKDPLGTAHAVMCAEKLLQGKVVVAFADTLFRADFKIENSADGILWVKQIDDPSSFGVVKMNQENEIIDFVEKPQIFVSDLAMIGVYYFKQAEKLKEEIQYLFDHKIIKSGEYQLPDALRRLTEKGTRFLPGKVNEWLDCGNKEVTVFTNQRVLDFDQEKNNLYVSKNAKIVNSVIIPPCYVGDNCRLENTIIGPHASIGKNSIVQSSHIRNSIVQENTHIQNTILENSMLGNFVQVKGTAYNLSLGDYSTSTCH